VSKRLEIELTSRRPDGTWTWRVAGARLPKGRVDGRLVPAAASVGAVLRAEADSSIEGLEIKGLIMPEEPPESTDRLELLSRRPVRGVTTSLAAGTRRRLSEGGAERDRGSRGAGYRARGRRDKRRRRDGRKSGAGARLGDGRERSRRDVRKAPRDRRMRSQSGGGPHTGRSERRSPRGRPGAPRSRPPRPRKPRPPRLKAKRVHRDAALSLLPQEQHLLAREVLRGGVPGVRNAIARMNKRAAAEGLPQIKSEPLVALAGKLAPGLKSAEWHDRAEATLEGIDTVDLRDIRSVVAAADRAARTRETKALAARLRTGLASRLDTEHRRWLAEMSACIGERRTVRALRLSSRPPKAGSPLPPDIYKNLSALAAADLSADASQQRWAAVLDALAFSPLRAHVKPAGLPDKPGAELVARVRKVGSRVPHIAAMFGVEVKQKQRRRVPPPPPPQAAESQTGPEARKPQDEPPTSAPTATPRSPQAEPEAHRPQDEPPAAVP